MSQGLGLYCCFESVVLCWHNVRRKRHTEGDSGTTSVQRALWHHQYNETQNEKRENSLFYQLPTNRTQPYPYSCTGDGA